MSEDTEQDACAEPAHFPVPPRHRRQFVKRDEQHRPRGESHEVPIEAWARRDCDETDEGADGLGNVVKTGWDLLADAMRVLLDASLDAKSLDEISKIVAADPAVSEITWITGRNAGRFRFVEAGVTLRPTERAKIEIAIARIEASVRAALPQVERVLLHLEPRASPRTLYAIPVADLAGAVSEHFGEAPYFAFVALDRMNGAIEEQHVRANPYRDEERAKGLRVAEWLTAQKVDRVVVPKSLEGKGPAYVFREAGVEVERSDARTVADFFAGRKEQA